MTDRINESLAGRLESTAPRALRFLGRRPPPRPGGSRPAQARVGPPDDEDERAIARKLRETMAARPRTPEGPAGRDVAAEADGIAAELVARARAVLAGLEGGASANSISGRDAVALEAVLHTRGRPALNVEGERIEDITDQKHPGSGFWRVFIDTHEQALVRVASAAGAVAVLDRFTQQRWVQGTAWLIRPDLVVTNRHVLFPPVGLKLARRNPGAMSARFKSDLEITIDFAFDAGPPRPSLRYPVVDIPFVAAESDPIDVGVIRIAPPAAVAASAPNPLTLANALFDSDQLYVIGHPGKMDKIPQEVLAVFGTPDERKRVSFGELMDPLANAAHIILHDASTIGGYSGGAVLGFRSQEVAALHFFGDPISGNRAISAPALRAHPVAAFL